MQILSQLFGLGSLVCLIMILIKLGKEKGILHVILGIISCGIYPFIWGWMHVNRLDVKKIMLAWSACWAASILISILIAVSSH